MDQDPINRLNKDVQRIKETLDRLYINTIKLNYGVVINPDEEKDNHIYSGEYYELKLLYKKLKRISRDYSFKTKLYAKLKKFLTIITFKKFRDRREQERKNKFQEDNLKPFILLAEELHSFGESKF